MSETVEQFMARKHDPNWVRRYRRVLRGYIPAGLRLPGEALPKRDHRGRFARGA